MSARIARLTAVAAAALVAASATVLGAPSASAAGTVVKLSTQNAPNLKMTKSAVLGKVVLGPDANVGTTKWRMEQVANLGGSRLAFTYTSLSSGGGCLDVVNDSKRIGDSLTVRPCDGTISQQWIRDFSTSGSPKALTNRNSGLVAGAGSATSNSTIKQGADVGAFAQRWEVFGV
jgi:hypothetical protein